MSTTSNDSVTVRLIGCWQDDVGEAELAYNVKVSKRDELPHANDTVILLSFRAVMNLNAASETTFP